MNQANVAQKTFQIVKGNPWLWYSKIQGSILLVGGTTTIIGILTAGQVGLLTHEVVHVITALLFLWAGIIVASPSKIIHQSIGFFYLVFAILGFLSVVEFPEMDLFLDSSHLFIAVMSLGISFKL